MEAPPSVVIPEAAMSQLAVVKKSQLVVAKKSQLAVAKPMLAIQVATVVVLL